MLTVAAIQGRCCVYLTGDAIRCKPFHEVVDQQSCDGNVLHKLVKTGQYHAERKAGAVARQPERHRSKPPLQAPESTCLTTWHVACGI